MKKGIYLKNTPLYEALRRWSEKAEEAGLKPLDPEPIDVRDSLGRVSAGPIFASVSSPSFHSSAMDGYAVRFAETFGASETKPLRLRVGSQAVYVDTGDPMPEGFNAVVMVEDINLISGDEGGQGHVEIIHPAAPWQHVRVIGEDIVITELILAENHRIRPVDIGALISGGHSKISVRRRPRVVVIPTGSELVEPGTGLKRGDIFEYNSQILSSLVSEWGGMPLRYPIVPDDIERLRQAVLSGCSEGDIIVVNAGSSAGSEDYTARVISELGEVVLHGVNIKPGKPVILGWVDGKPVLGIPGYPVSAYLTFNLFAKELVFRLQGLEPPHPDIRRVRLSRQVSSNLGQEEFLRVKLGKVGDAVIATPVSRGAGVLMSLVRADGIVKIPAMSEGFGAGAEVDVEMLRGMHEIENTVVCIGSHDNALDLLANMLKKLYPGYALSSAHVGSMGGLVALRRNEAHIAGTHLLDEESGEYNVPFIKKMLGDRKIMLVNLVYRQQGLVVRKGNPRGIKDFGDLTQKDVTFINRQAGSGTRLLTDKYLKDRGISPSLIKGYEREEYTHMGVASAVLTGVADAGMAILASAKALGLDFIPLARERYDIAIPGQNLDLPHVAALIKIIRENEEFRAAVENLGGYDISDMGRVMYEA